MSTPDRWRKWAALGAVVGVSLFAAACGSSSDSSDSGSSNGAAAGTPTAGADPVVAQAKADVEKGYGTGFVKPPPTTGPPAQKGKNVWLISCGEAYNTCVTQSNEFRKAGKALGWKVNVVDGKATPTVASGLIRQAVAAKADGIVVNSYDCPDLKGALETAKAAKIPTVSFAGFDCNAPEFGGTGESLYTLPKILGEASPAGLFTPWGKMLAQYAIAKQNGKMNVLDVNCTGKAVCKAIHAGWLEGMKACSGCKITDVGYTFAQVPNPATQQWKSAILSNPNANVLSYFPSGLQQLGLQTAIKQAGRKLTVYGAEGGDINFNLIRSGFEQNAVVRQDPQAIWATADTLNRLFAGQTSEEMPDEGGGYQVVDKEHNLPAEGQPIKPALDFAPLYEKVWDGNGQ
jgi:ribose transport system substrate-binding protein